MTAIQAHADGHWLRVGRRIPAGPRSALLRRGRLRAIGGCAAIAAACAVAAMDAGLMSSTSRSPAPPGAPAPGAVQPLAASPSVPAVPAGLAASFERWGHEYGVPVALLAALTWHESRWQPTVVSEAGAMGLGQLMPGTAEAVAASIGENLDPWRADDNVRMCAHLLGTLLTSAGGDVRAALAGYAQGASSVVRQGMTPTTRRYVDEIIALYEEFRGAPGAGAR